MKKIFLTLTLSLVVFLAGCSSNQPVAQISTQTATKNSTTTSTSTPKVFTLADLKNYNGQNGSPAYVAVDGVVYDVTNAKGWVDGMHKMGITAGADLTSVIDQSPHGKGVLKNLSIVGKLSK